MASETALVSHCHGALLSLAHATEASTVFCNRRMRVLCGFCLFEHGRFRRGLSASLSKRTKAQMLQSCVPWSSLSVPDQACPGAAVCFSTAALNRRKGDSAVWPFLEMRLTGTQRCSNDPDPAAPAHHPCPPCSRAWHSWFPLYTGKSLRAFSGCPRPLNSLLDTPLSRVDPSSRASLLLCFRPL